MSEGSFFSTYLDPEYYEPLERYKPSSEYLQLVQRYVDSTWKISRGGYWTRCFPENAVHLEHGWKIHLAASTMTAVELLERTLPVLVRSRLAFKFCADPDMLALSLNKNAPRTGAGKFVTIYPDSEEDFKKYAEELYQATGELWGPFLLTDRPYKDSKVVFYRYGTHWALERVNERGQRESGMRAPDGSWVSDDRRPYFALPSWVKDPFAGWKSGKAASGGSGMLLNNRFRVEGALKFNASGGIYRGTDTQTGAPVILREARPLTCKDPKKEETFLLLEKEARILQKLEPTGYTPRYVDLFMHWEHMFLVQEKLDAESLWGYAIGFSRTSAEQRASHFFTRMRDTVKKIALALKSIHEHGVVLRDLTRSNIMFTKDHQVKFIDLEFAYEMDREEAYVRSWTDGHSSPEQRRWEKPKPGDDCYSLGAMILDQIVFTAPGLDLNREGILRSFRQSLEDYHLPMAIYEIVLGLLEPDPSRRWDIDRLIAAFDSIPVPEHDAPLIPTGQLAPPLPPPPASLRPEIEQTIEGISRFILAKTDYSRNDRLWPARPGIYSTNPLSLEYGAAGIAYFLHRQNGGLPPEVIKWMLKQQERHICPPGLFSGWSGIALVLQELGQHEAASKAMEDASKSELLHKEFDLFWGDSGWGLANLHFWRNTGEEKYLTRALEVGEYLMRTKQENSDGVYWLANNEKRLGLGHGQVGAALFLIYLSKARPGEGFLETAIKAVDFEIAHCQYLDDVLLWYPHVDARASDPKSPHMRYGTAGVGTVVLRAYLASGEPRLRKFAERCANTVTDRHTNKLWYNYGMAGYGEYLLDMYRLLGDERYLNWAYFQAEGLLPHRIYKEEGIAFAAEELFRISCDLAGGSAGIGLFLHRLLRPEQPHFLLRDELLGLQPDKQR
jgi:serine/threonine protein kinase/rhamnogalacturonyl hydrolase YesR